ncbi:MAG: ATP-binding protein, partial [Muribaculaceae bacterium]|nr:ATP-binding protein [Muribaculaceae bacterium]
GYVKLWAREEDGDLLLSVSDNGPGIPPAVLEQLNSGDKQIPGGHLGLNNVSSILRLHYGERYGLSAKASAGEGSCVCLRLPIRREENADAEGFDR